MSIKNIVILVFVFCAWNCSAVSDISESSFGRFKEGIIAAFGDFNSDELTDAFVIINASSIQVFLAHDKEPFLRPSSYACNFSNIVITSIVPGDYDGDAYMDILLTTQTKDVNPTDLHEVRILWGGMPSLNCSDALLIKAISIGQPLVLDYNRDMTLDLFGVNTQRQRVFWVFKKDRSAPSEKRMGDDTFKEIKLPHSHSFLDINDDNAADLLVTTKLDIEVWLSEKTNGFRYNNSIELLIGHPAIYGQALFLDVALSGDFSLIIPVCFDIECFNSTILIYFDEHWHDLEIDLNDGRGTLWRFTPPRNEIYLDTVTMRSGDFNMDGYPDILMTLSPLNSNETKVFLLHNVACSPECTDCRTFKVQWDTFESFGKNVIMATFYDFYMDGVLDIVYVKKNVTTNKYTMHAFRNELEYDTNFMKVIVVTGLTNEITPTINGTLYNRKLTFGTNLPGPKISYDTWSQEGNYRTGVCAQLSQSAHFSLQLPYSIFGLDRTPNFVDSLNVGLSGYSKSWTQIIPNSQIVVTPAPPDDPSQWRVQLFVTPSKVILKSVFVLLAVIVVIIWFVIYLHWKERHDRQDIIDIDEEVLVKI